MEFYQVIGWYKSLRRESWGKSTTVSDGAMFSNPDHAKAYAREKMALYEIRKRSAESLPADVDYYIRDGIWVPPEARGAS
jgi:hypothetical protein